MSKNELRAKVGRGFAWSAAGVAAMRMGSLVVGIVLANLLSPHAFGIYAVGLMVQAILMNFAELGLAADLVRHGDIERRGPTVTTIALGVSVGLTVLIWFGAGPLAAATGAPEATLVIQLLGFTLPLAAVTAVPYAQLQREFQQSRLFAVEFTNFGVSTALTIVLAVAGMGPLSLAIGKLVGQSVATLLQFVVTGVRLRVGWIPEVASSGLRFGFPLACAGLLSWTLLNVDTVLVTVLAGTTALGFYVLAFNISSWPSSVIGTAVRAVAFPAFAERGRSAGERDVAGLLRGTELVWTLSLPVSLGLAVLAGPVISILYPERWAPSAAVLTALAAFGALRVVFDLWVAYLTACGAGGWLVGNQVMWIALLVPAMYAGIGWDGIRGAGWAHVAVALMLMLPIHLIALGRHGVPAQLLIRTLLPAVAASIPAVSLSLLAVRMVDGSIVQLLLGGSVLVLGYAACIWPWLRHRLPARSNPVPDPDPAHSEPARVS